MDVLAVNTKSKSCRSQANKRRSKKGIKVVYISSPMKVETSAAKFRALVQELTGKDSDTARFMDGNNGGSGGGGAGCDDNQSINLNLNSPDNNLDRRSSGGVVDDELQGSLVHPFMNNSYNYNYNYNNDSSSSSPDSDSVFDVEQIDHKFLPPMEGSFLSMFHLNNNIFHELDVFN